MSLADHASHKWSQVGRCVYCDDCNVRLYQGKLPARGQQQKEATAIDDMLAPIRAKFEAKAKKEWDERTPEQEAAWRVGRHAYKPGASIVYDRKNPFKGTDLAKWFNMGWTNAEFAHYESQREADA